MLFLGAVLPTTYNAKPTTFLKPRSGTGGTQSHQEIQDSHQQTRRDQRKANAGKVGQQADCWRENCYEKCLELRFHRKPRGHGLMIYRVANVAYIHRSPEILEYKEKEEDEYCHYLNAGSLEKAAEDYQDSTQKIAVIESPGIISKPFADTTGVPGSITRREVDNEIDYAHKNRCPLLWIVSEHNWKTQRHCFKYGL